MKDKKIDNEQKLKELEIEVRELMMDANSIEIKIPDRLRRIKDLEAETEKAKLHVRDLYANLRTLNNQIMAKNADLKEIMDIFTGNFLRPVGKEEKKVNLKQ